MRISLAVMPLPHSASYIGRPARRSARHVEAAYVEMVERHARGALPQDLFELRLADAQKAGNGVHAQRSGGEQLENLQAHRNRKRLVKLGKLIINHKPIAIDLYTLVSLMSTAHPLDIRRFRLTRATAWLNRRIDDLGMCTRLTGGALCEPLLAR